MICNNAKKAQRPVLSVEFLNQTHHALIGCRADEVVFHFHVFCWTEDKLFWIGKRKIIDEVIGDEERKCTQRCSIGKGCFAVDGQKVSSGQSVFDDLVPPANPAVEQKALSDQVFIPGDFS